MAGIFGNTMNTSSSSESVASSFMESQATTAQGTTGSSGSINQINQVASQSYNPPSVARPQDQGETSISLPIFTPRGTMDFRKWATEGYNADGPILSGPKGDIDYDHEAGYNAVDGSVDSYVAG